MLRLFRLFRLARIARLLQGQRKKDLIEDILHNRSQYATFITLLLAFLVLVSSSLAVLQFESRSPDANITTGGDALWWSAVTITTVGYGDYFPVTTLGRFAGLLVMLAGVGIIGALASILASLLVSPAPAKPEETAGAEAAAGVELNVPAVVPAELAQTRTEMAQTRAEMAELRRQLSAMSGPAPAWTGAIGRRLTHPSLTGRRRGTDLTHRASTAWAAWDGTGGATTRPTIASSCCPHGW